MDEGTGTSVLDYSGNGFTGTIINAGDGSNSWVPGKVPLS